MSMLECACGNSRRWRNVRSDPTGTSATCGNCGKQVSNPQMRPAMPVQIGQAEDMVIGTDLSRVNVF